MIGGSVPLNATDWEPSEEEGLLSPCLARVFPGDVWLPALRKETLEDEEPLSDPAGLLVPKDMGPLLSFQSGCLRGSKGDSVFWGKFNASQGDPCASLIRSKSGCLRQHAQGKCTQDECLSEA